MADFVFGQTYSDSAPTSEMSGSTWIRKFPMGSTLIRIFPAYAKGEKGQDLYGVYAWPWEWEHFDEAIGTSYPCMRKYGQDCRGCASNVERTSQRQKFYYINAIDEKGNLRIYKLGQTLWEAFQRRQDKFMAQDPTELQPLSQRNYSVDRSGEKLKTRYEVEAGDKYAVDFPEEYPSIPQALADSFNEAMEKYQGGSPKAASDDENDDDIEDDEPTGGVAALTKSTDKPAASPLGTHSGGANKDGTAKPLAEQQPEEEGLPDDPTPEQIAHASTPSLRAWLTAHEVEFPARAPRSRLMSIIAKELEPPF